MIPALTFATYAITLDGRPVLPRARAAVAGGRVLLPVRALGTALGANVGYDARTHRIVVRHGNRIVTLRAGGAVRIVSGHAYAPLRAAADAFALDVAYLPAARTVALRHATIVNGAVPRPSAPSGPDRAATAYSPPPVQARSLEMTPPDGARIHDPYPSISARFVGANVIDRRSLRVVLDGRDVTAEAALIGDQVLFTPRTALLPGNHDVAVSAQTLDGTPLATSWRFVDTFAFSTAPPPTPYPIGAFFIDRYVTPGTNAFDVIVQGAPGITGFVGVEGVGRFPLLVYANNGYVAHIVVPYGVFVPYARVAARLTLPDGTVQTIELPQRIPLVTVTPSPAPQPRGHTPLPRYVPTPQPSATPARRRSLDVPTASPTSSPAAAPSASPSPATAAAPKPHRRVPLATPRQSPIPIASAPP